MREKEIAEIRRQLQPQRHAITHIYGCYVNEEKEIITTFAQSLGLMPEDETEKYLALFRRCLSGTLNKNLLDFAFSTRQVAEGEEHSLLMKLRDTALSEDKPRKEFYEKVISTQPVEGNYLILLLHNRYDVPFKQKDGKYSEDSADVYSYIQCAICPVKLSKATLSYKASESEFHNTEPGWVVSAPELGFLFPSFDERSTNIYNALVYSHDLNDGHEGFMDTLFKGQLPMPANQQKDAFQGILGSTLDKECTLEAVKTVHEQLCQMIQAHKESKDTEALVISKEDISSMLEECGISEEKTTAFRERMDEEFGAEKELSPKNIIDHKKIEVVTPDVVIRIAPDKGHLLQKKVLGGVPYILIRADESVEVNGVAVCLDEDEEKS